MVDVNQLFKDKTWLLKTCRNHSETFRFDDYWEILKRLKDEKVFIQKKEIFHIIFFSILPFRVWFHFWCCCRSQFNPDICQFCAKLRIKDRKVVNFINKRLVLDVRKLFPPDLYYTTACNSDVSLFVHVQFGPDRQRSYSKNNYRALYYEVTSSPFLIFENYVDIMGNIILNHCDKIILPELFKGENEFQCRDCTVCLPKNYFPPKWQKIRQFVYLSAFKLIKRLVVATCQTVNWHPIINCYETYTLWKHYHNPYLTIDRPKKEENKDE